MSPRPSPCFISRLNTLSWLLNDQLIQRTSPSLPSTEQTRRAEDAHKGEQLQDAEEEKDDSNEEENKDSLVDDEEEKEDLGEEDEAEEDEEEDSPAARVDEERSDAQDQGPLREVQEEGEPEPDEDTPAPPSPADTEAAEDTLRQRRSQHADKGPSAWWQYFREFRPRSRSASLWSAL